MALQAEAREDVSGDFPWTKNSEMTDCVLTKIYFCFVSFFNPSFPEGKDAGGVERE